MKDFMKDDDKFNIITVQVVLFRINADEAYLLLDFCGNLRSRELSDNHCLWKERLRSVLNNLSKLPELLVEYEKSIENPLKENVIRKVTVLFKTDEVFLQAALSNDEDRKECRIWCYAWCVNKLWTQDKL